VADLMIVELQPDSGATGDDGEKDAFGGPANRNMSAGDKADILIVTIKFTCRKHLMIGRHSISTSVSLIGW
jgi:hypothetical protein